MNLSTATRLVRAARVYSRAQTTLVRAQERADRAGGILRSAVGPDDGIVTAGLWRIQVTPIGGLQVRVIPAVPIDQLPLPLEWEPAPRS
jgi:hypothetical protein